jgi:hypothetical protein
MATATVVQPSSAYPASAPYSSNYPPSGSSMITSAEPRRPADDGDSSKRQSLPSLSEVISSTKSTPYAPSPQSSMQQPSNSFPSPFSGPPRTYGETEKHTPSQPLRPTTSFAPSREPLSSFADSPRNSYNSRPGLPSPADPTKPEIPPHHYPHEPPKDHRPMNGATYPQQAPQSASTPTASWPTGTLPHGQMPLPAYPPSPRHAAPPHGYAPYDQRGPPARVEDGERRPPYEAPMYNAPWAYGESLGRLAQSSRTLFNFAEAYGRIAQEQHGAHTIPERLPTEQEVNDMLSNAEMVRTALEQVKEAVQHSIRNERAREAPKVKASYEEEQDVPMFEDGIKSQYAITEVKKRRGRAAPPGRCHSCNRVDTPEWRRGPDGARTLCNACGLHYAKLERKRQLEQRNIRPKPDDRS